MANSIPLLHRDDYLVVADKPAGVSSLSDPGLDGPSLPELLERDGLSVLPVHRLDRDVSGAILFALDPTTRDLLEALFRERALQKTYWGLAQGQLKPASGAWHFPILEEAGRARVSAVGKKSLTRYRTLEALPTTTAVEMDLITGRYNQIRLHFAHAGFPLVGERKYARGKDSPLRFRSRRVALHAWRLALGHPRTGELLQVEAPLPSDLCELLGRARKG